MNMIRYGIGVTVLGMSLPVAAMEFKLGDEVVANIGATATVGTMIRTESPDPAVFGTLSAARVGSPPGQLGGNAGRSDFNFRKDHPVSTVLKGVVDIELRHGDVGVFARAKAWHDFELKDGDRAYGNGPNGFRKDVPLSDGGFVPEAKFSNVQMADLYAFGRVGEGIGAMDVRAGRQVVNWGEARLTAGGVDIVNPADYAARVRPGALPEETKLPVGMIYVNLAGGREWGAEGFVQYEFRPNALVPCGTFFDTAYYAPVGCNYVSVLGSSGVDDATAIATGRYPKRSPDRLARDGGQYGLSLRRTIADADLRVYAMNYHSRVPSISGTNPNIAGGYGSLATLTRLTDPNGLKYNITYPEDIKLYGLGISAKLNAATRLYGELAYRPNQPVNLNPSDLIAAALTRSQTTALNRAKNTNAIPPGGSFDGYDRFRVATMTLGADQHFGAALGAERITLRGELGWSHVAGLPDAGVLRYGRTDDYGVAAIGGVPCVDTTAAQKSCAHDGFVTSNAWGYRLRIAARYPLAFFDAAVSPSLSYSRDVRGYSYDGTFLKGRTIVRPGVRLDWGERYFAEVQYTRIAGGDYNTLVDRDNVVFVFGARL